MDNQMAVSSWSGGKDSCLAYYKAIQQGYEVKCLLNFISKETKRGSSHGIKSKLMQLQAEYIGIPLIQKEVTRGMPEYEKEFKETVSGLKSSGVKAAIFGDIYCGAHKEWVERVCCDLGVTPVEPLWGRETEDIITEFIDSGFKTVVVSAKADLFDKNFVGRIMDKDLVSELKRKNICPCGENGEFHTFVIDGPIFKKRIEILESEPVLKEDSRKRWFLDIRKYR